MPTSNVNLTPELLNFVQQQVESGHYNNHSEVHRAALVALKKSEEERDARIARLRGDIQEGIDSMNQGGALEISSSEDADAFFEKCESAVLDRRAKESV
jgi:antitoxin ParD1/3/4